MRLELENGGLDLAAIWVSGMLAGMEKIINEYQ